MTLLSDYEVCKEGDVLTPEQARVLVSQPEGLLLQPSPGLWGGAPLGSSLVLHLLTPGSLGLLQKLFGYEMAEFKVTVKYMWDAQSGRFQQMGEDLPESASESEPESEEDEDD